MLRDNIYSISYIVYYNILGVQKGGCIRAEADCEKRPQQSPFPERENCMGDFQGGQSSWRK